jgi:hypothetical protein
MKEVSNFLERIKDIKDRDELFKLIEEIRTDSPVSNIQIDLFCTFVYIIYDFNKTTPRLTDW